MPEESQNNQNQLTTPNQSQKNVPEAQPVSQPQPETNETLEVNSGKSTFKKMAVALIVITLILVGLAAAYIMYASMQSPKTSNDHVMQDNTTPQTSETPVDELEKDLSDFDDEMTQLESELDSDIEFDVEIPTI